jgi:hypothetical protein
MKKNILILLCAVLILATVAGVAVASYIMTSNTVITNPTAQATLILTQDNSTPIVLVDTVLYTATCSDLTFSGQVTFKDGSTTLDTITAVNGIATLAYIPTSTTQLSVIATAEYP